jgi:hypothetical protein
MATQYIDPDSGKTYVHSEEVSGQTFEEFVAEGRGMPVPDPAVESLEEQKEEVLAEARTAQAAGEDTVKHEHQVDALNREIVALQGGVTRGPRGEVVPTEPSAQEKAFKRVEAVPAAKTEKGYLLPILLDSGVSERDLRLAGFKTEDVQEAEAQVTAPKTLGEDFPMPGVKAAVVVEPAEERPFQPGLTAEQRIAMVEGVRSGSPGDYRYDLAGAIQGGIADQTLYDAGFSRRAVREAHTQLERQELGDAAQKRVVAAIHSKDTLMAARINQGQAVPLGEAIYKGADPVDLALMRYPAEAIIEAKELATALKLTEDHRDRRGLRLVSAVAGNVPDESLLLLGATPEGIAQAHAVWTDLRRHQTIALAAQEVQDYPGTAEMIPELRRGMIDAATTAAAMERVLSVLDQRAPDQAAALRAGEGILLPKAINLGVDPTDLVLIDFKGEDVRDAKDVAHAATVFEDYRTGEKEYDLASGIAGRAPVGATWEGPRQEVTYETATSFGFEKPAIQTAVNTAVMMGVSAAELERRGFPTEMITAAQKDLIAPAAKPRPVPKPGEKFEVPEDLEAIRAEAKDKMFQMVSGPGGSDLAATTPQFTSFARRADLIDSIIGAAEKGDIPWDQARAGIKTIPDEVTPQDFARAKFNLGRVYQIGGAFFTPVAVAGTALTWEMETPTGRAISVGADFLSAIPMGAVAVASARSAGALTKGARLQRIAADVAMAEIMGPIQAIRYPIKAVKLGIYNPIEAVLSYRRVLGQEVITNTLRAPATIRAATLADDLLEQAKQARAAGNTEKAIELEQKAESAKQFVIKAPAGTLDELGAGVVSAADVKNAVSQASLAVMQHGESIKVPVGAGGSTLEMSVPSSQRILGKGAFHATSDGRNAMAGDMVIAGKEGGVYFAPTPLSRFAEATSTGKPVELTPKAKSLIAAGELPDKPVPSIYWITDQKLLDQLKGAEMMPGANTRGVVPGTPGAIPKVFKGLAEFEAILPNGVVMPKPSQVLYQRGAGGQRYQLLVFGDPLTPAQLAALKLSGTKQAVANIFSPPAVMRFSGGGEISAIAQKADDLVEQARLARAAGNTEKAIQLERDAERLQETVRLLESNFSETITNVVRSNADELARHADDMAGEAAALRAAGATDDAADALIRSTRATEYARETAEAAGRIAGGGLPIKLGRVLRAPAGAPAGMRIDAAGRVIADGQRITAPGVRVSPADRVPPGEIERARFEQLLPTGREMIRAGQEIIAPLRIRTTAPDRARVGLPERARIGVPEQPIPRLPGVEPPTVRLPGPERPTPRVPGPERPTPRVPGLERPTPRVPGPERPTPRVPGLERPTPRVPGPERPTPRVPGPERPTPRIPGLEKRIPPSIPGPERPKPRIPGLEKRIPPSIPGPERPEPRIPGLEDRTTPRIPGLEDRTTPRIPGLEDRTTPRIPGLEKRIPKEIAPRIKLPNGEELPAGWFPHIVEWPQGNALITRDLQTGQTTYTGRKTDGTTARKGFKVLKMSRQRPVGGDLDIGAFLAQSADILAFRPDPKNKDQRFRSRRGRP